jgi:alanyl-tRNA synthetase
MTTRLYYDDSMLQSFDAKVIACDTNAGRVEVVLDRTAFYPTSGGQPFDLGTLGVARVTDVLDRDDGTIVHVVSEEIPVGQRVMGVIDWPRRFDHMQQHTGQHILSAVFDRLHGVRTESFHLGTDSSTIDLAREVTPAEIAAAEDAASRVVWEDRAVVVRFADVEEAARLPLRKEPTRQGPLRLIEVDDFDLSACGGTHVPRTGMIGVIAVAGWERFKGASRVTFVCGGRALRSHAALRDATMAASRLLSVAAAEVPAAIERLQSDLKQATRTVEQLREEVTKSRAEQLRARAETIHGLRVVLRREPGAEPAALKALAAAVVADAGTLAVLVGDGQPASVVVARSTDVPFDAGAWMRRVTSTFGGRGGGRPEQAQGGVPAAADDILGFARKTLEESVVLNSRRSDSD